MAGVLDDADDSAGVVVAFFEVDLSQQVAMVVGLLVHFHEVLWPLGSSEHFLLVYRGALLGGGGMARDITVPWSE